MATEASNDTSPITIDKALLSFDSFPRIHGRKKMVRNPTVLVWVEDLSTKFLKIMFVKNPFILDGKGANGSAEYRNQL